VTLHHFQYNCKVVHLLQIQRKENEINKL
jgi:hypothetical protein